MAKKKRIPYNDASGIHLTFRLIWMSTYTLLIARFWPFSFYGLHVFVCHHHIARVFNCRHQENWMMSKKFPVYGQLDWTLRTFSHRNPVVWEGNAKPLYKAGVWVQRGVSTSGHCRSLNMLRCMQGMECAPFPKFIWLCSFFQGASDRGHILGNVTLDDLCLHDLESMINSAYNLFSFQHVGENKKTRTELN